MLQRRKNGKLGEMVVGDVGVVPYTSRQGLEMICLHIKYVLRTFSALITGYRYLVIILRYLPGL